ncbi:MAG: hypothetical protein C0617_11025 [Desulfuromonas sp.]|uniref:ATP-binding protein n=1 Tax=Desulfuromonas sp. TaxID=892 RepID=UPI000CB48889|nr:ATP-binding protein [Desulfuromonas sp.]PLX83659.1 MAG: hypothetical protein C0617_11025 [Desulfuromonas sp.]
MITQPFIGLLNNAALLLVLGVLYGTLYHRSDSTWWRLLRGFFLGAIAVGVMMNPWQLAPGMIFDTRTIVLSTGGMFLGSVPTAIAVVMAGLYRYHVGGVGTLTGIIWVVVSGASGLAWARARKRPPVQLSWREFYLLGLVVHLVLLALMFTMPDGLALPILEKITLPVLLIFPVATVLLAKLLSSQEIQARDKAALDASERKYKELVQNARAVLLRIDTRGDITFFNEYAQEFFGYSEEEILGENVVGTIVPARDTAGRDLKEKIQSILRNPDRFFENENENLCRDGRRVRILWKNTPLCDDSGKVVGIQAVGHDITELRRAEGVLLAREEEFHRLVEMSPLPLVIVEQNHDIVFLNRKFTELFGYTHEDIPTIEKWWPLAYPDPEYRKTVMDRWNAAAAKAIEEKSDIAPQEARVTCKDGSVRDVVGRLASIGEKEIVVLTDMSRERAFDRIKSEFIATAAHELRTPLTAVRGFTELLLNEKDLDQAQRDEFLSIVNDKTEVLERIIDDLLDLGRVESGRVIHLETEPSDVGALVASAVASYRKAFPKRQIDLAWPEAGPGKISADAGKVGQVMENLLSNAVKFSPADAPVRVSATTAEGELQVAVRDEGAGMSPEQAARIFDKFYRADSSNTAVPGLGLGMAIVKNIVEAHGGRIWVESERGRGTTVTFTLPLKAKAS